MAVVYLVRIREPNTTVTVVPRASSQHSQLVY